MKQSPQHIQVTLTTHTNTPSTRNKEIRDTLLSRNVLTDPRIKTCGKWINLETPYPPRPKQIFCGKYNCRVCRHNHIEETLTKHFIENKKHKDKGGHFFQITLTVPHSSDETFSDIYPRFIKSLKEMKTSRGWRKIQQLTDYRYHYDNIECHQTPNGYHIHDHITFCGMNDTTPPQTIQKELFKTWNYHTRKNGFKPVSRGGVSVYQTPFTNHSGSMEIKSIEEQTQKYGTTEYWENELHKIHTDETYTHPDKTTEEIEQELKTRYRVTKTTRRGKIQRPKTLPTLSQKDLQTNVLIDTNGNHHSINSLSTRSLYEEDNTFTNEETQRHLQELRRGFQNGYYCELYETDTGRTGYKWKKDTKRVYT